MRTLTRLAPLAAAVLLLGCAALSSRTSVPAGHAERLGSMPVSCLECHEDETSGALKPFDAFNHTNTFLLRHGVLAGQGQNLCASCHRADFCLDCHAGDELGTGLRKGSRPDRAVPHRGDYLVSHRIDGKLDPGSCVRCHGNRNSERCLACHK